jgi:hypothetical protein
MRADQQVYIIERPTNDGKDHEIVYIDPSWKNLLITLATQGEVEIEDSKGALTLMRVGQHVPLKVNGHELRARSWYMQSTKFLTEHKPFAEVITPEPEEKPAPKTTAKAS